MQLAENVLVNNSPLRNLRFLEYSIACESVLHTLEFFQQLGFTPLPTNDIRDYAYAVITDGRCFLGLHEKNSFEKISDQPRLSFVHDDIPPIVKHLNNNSITVLQADLAEDEFQQTVFKGPNHSIVNILAARSFSPPPRENYKDSVLGYFRGIVSPTTRLDKSTEFWEQMGLLVMPTLDDDVVAVSSNQLTMLLVDNDEISEPGVIFEHPKPESLFPHFSRYGINLEVSEQHMILESEYLLKAPNGLHIWVKRED
jgi:predicted lactoylglutathione lyase